MRAASVSFGKDSTAMLLRMLEEGPIPDAVVFYNTGMEFDAVYRVRDAIRERLDSNGVHFVELHPVRPMLYDMLEKPVCKRNGTVHRGYGWCGGPARWGTTFKSRAMDKWCREAGVNVHYLGIAADETHRPRLEGKSYPLVEWGMSEADCLEYCRQRGISWIEGGVDLYSVLDRVSCWCCRNKNLKELKAIREHLPETWARLCDLEDRIGVPMKSKPLKEI